VRLLQSQQLMLAQILIVILACRCLDLWVPVVKSSLRRLANEGTRISAHLFLGSAILVIYVRPQSGEEVLMAPEPCAMHVVFIMLNLSVRGTRRSLQAQPPRLPKPRRDQSTWIWFEPPLSNELASRDHSSVLPRQNLPRAITSSSSHQELILVVMAK